MILLNALKTKFVNRIIALEKGKASSKMQNIVDRHNKSKTLDSRSIIELEKNKQWEIPSQTISGEKYKMKRVGKCQNNCVLKCNECLICIHDFNCTCPDYAIRFVICKHIHLLCTHLNRDSFDSDNLIIDESTNLLEKEILENLLSSHNEQNEVESERNKAISLLTNMIIKCESPSMTTDQLKTVINSIKEVDRKLFLKMPIH